MWEFLFIPYRDLAGGLRYYYNGEMACAVIAACLYKM
jgi:hypothetical protein